MGQDADRANPNPADLQDIILRLCRDCAAPGAGRGSISLQDAARAAGGDANRREEWRRLLRTAREATGALQRAGRVQVLRKGRPVDMREAKGVIRVALAPE